MSRQFTWKKSEKLKSRKRIERLFEEGKRLSLFPFNVVYQFQAQPAESWLQAGFAAGSRHFKRAVDRNRIKRLSREAYRLQKTALEQRLKDKGLYLAVFFIYTGRELPDFPAVNQKIGVILQKLVRELG